MSEQNNPHDAFFKQYLSQPRVASDFLRQYLPAEILALIDLSQLQLEKDSFVDEKLRAHFSDLIYSTTTRFNTDLRIAFLYEHKSYPDDWVDFQVLRYQVSYWVQEFEHLNAEADKAKEQPKRPRLLTPIVVLLVYHGKTNWQVSLSFCPALQRHGGRSASPLAQALARYVPAFEPHFINLTSMADEAIQGEVRTRMMALVLKHIFEPQLGGHLDEVLQLASEVIHQPSGVAMVLTLLRYIGRAATRIDRSEMAQKLLTYLPKEGGVLMQTMAQE
ncbi:MAG: Rpn family recombination-promoting nuclease/putative transposase [Caldilineaceae bacterium]